MFSASVCKNGEVPPTVILKDYKQKTPSRPPCMLHDALLLYSDVRELREYTANIWGERGKREMRALIKITYSKTFTFLPTEH